MATHKKISLGKLSKESEVRETFFSLLLGDFALCDRVYVKPGENY